MKILRKGSPAPEVFGRQIFKAGQLIFREGADASCAYILETGQVTVSKLADGDDQTIGTLGKGELLGEMALIDDSPRTATARALEHTTLLCIDRKRFKKKIDNIDPFIGRLLRILTQNVRSITDRHVTAVKQLDGIEKIIIKQ
jgi:CRP-like cAMP-binding protein